MTDFREQALEITDNYKCDGGIIKESRKGSDLEDRIAKALTLKYQEGWNEAIDEAVKVATKYCDICHGAEKGCICGEIANEIKKLRR